VAALAAPPTVRSPMTSAAAIAARWPRRPLILWVLIPVSCSRVHFGSCP
jgi:hypothetical protein